MGNKIRQLWTYIQDLLDVKGDAIMCVMSSVYILRVLMAMNGKHPGLTSSEAALYASAIASFAYSNRG